eukprot:8210-Heterococcus_DN1.PRE.3
MSQIAIAYKSDASQTRCYRACTKLLTHWTTASTGADIRFHTGCGSRRFALRDNTSISALQLFWCSCNYALVDNTHIALSMLKL